MSESEPTLLRELAAGLVALALAVVLVLPIQCFAPTIVPQWKPESPLSAHPEARWKSLSSYFDKPALGDVTGDGVPEIIGTSIFGDVYCIDGASGRTLWAFEDEHSFDLAIYVCPAVVDVNCDGIADVVSVTPKGLVVCLDGRNGRRLWTFKADGAVISSPAAFDLKRDGTLEIAFADLRGNVYLLDGSGKLIWETAEGAPFCGAPSLGIVDGKAAVIISDRLGVLRCYGGADGKLIWRTAPAKGPISTSPVVFRDEKDAAHPWKALIGTDLGGLILVNPRDGTIIWSRTLGQAEAIGDFALGDVNGDGLLDCAFSTSASRVLAVSAEDGREIWSRKLKIPTKLNPTVADLRRIRSDVISGQPVLCDVDGDGLEDVIVDIRGPNNFLYVLRGLDGSVLWSWGNKKLLLNPASSEMIVVGGSASGIPSVSTSFSVPDTSQPTPVIADFTGDGKAEMIINDRDELGLISVPLSATAGKGRWAKFSGDPCNNIVKSSLPCVGTIPDLSLLLTIDPPKISAGQAARLCWKSTGARVVEIDPGPGVVGPEGCADVSPPQTTTWKARARGCKGGAARLATLAVEGRLPTGKPPADLGSPPPSGAVRLEDVVFEVSSYRLTPEARNRLDRNALQLKSAADTAVALEAGCDEGDSPVICEYMALARAEEVREFLIERGIDGARLELRKAGIRETWAPARSGPGWAANRRVHFTVLRRD